MTSKTATPLDHAFVGPIIRETNSGWLCVVMPDSGNFFGTRRPVKIAGTIDGHPFNATMLPMGDGTHMVPIKAALRSTIGKHEPGLDVTVHLAQRLS